MGGCGGTGAGGAPFAAAGLVIAVESFGAPVTAIALVLSVAAVSVVAARVVPMFGRASWLSPAVGTELVGLDTGSFAVLPSDFGATMSAASPEVLVAITGAGSRPVVAPCGCVVVALAAEVACVPGCMALPFVVVPSIVAVTTTAIGAGSLAGAVAGPWSGVPLVCWSCAVGRSFFAGAEAVVPLGVLRAASDRGCWFVLQLFDAVLRCEFDSPRSLDAASVGASMVVVGS